MDAVALSAAEQVAVLVQELRDRESKLVQSLADVRAEILAIRKVVPRLRERTAKAKKPRKAAVAE